MDQTSLPAVYICSILSVKTIQVFVCMPDGFFKHSTSLSIYPDISIFYLHTRATKRGALSLNSDLAKSKICSFVFFDKFLLKPKLVAPPLNGNIVVPSEMANMTLFYKMTRIHCAENDEIISHSINSDIIFK